LPQYDKEILLALFSTIDGPHNTIITRCHGGFRDEAFVGLFGIPVLEELVLHVYVYATGRVLYSRMTSFPRRTIYLVISEKLVCARSRSSDWIGKGLENPSALDDNRQILFEILIGTVNGSYFQSRISR